MGGCAGGGAAPPPRHTVWVLCSFTVCNQGTCASWGVIRSSAQTLRLLESLCPTFTPRASSPEEQRLFKFHCVPGTPILAAQIQLSPACVMSSGPVVCGWCQLSPSCRPCVGFLLSPPSLTPAPLVAATSRVGLRGRDSSAWSPVHASGTGGEDKGREADL